MIGTFLLLFIVLSIIDAETKPEPCSLSADSLNECLRLRAQELFHRMATVGLPEMGLAPVEPFTVDDYNGGGGFGTNNVTIYGIKGAVFNSIKLNYKKRKMIINVTCNPEIHANFRYQGTFLAATALGKAIIIAVNTEMSFKIYFTTINKDGKDYWRVIKHQVSYIPEKITHDIKVDEPAFALFAGWAGSFMDGHYKEVHNDIEAPITILLSNKIVYFLDLVFGAIPLDEIFKP